jgi:hypothetical protein
MADLYFHQRLSDALRFAHGLQAVVRPARKLLLL